MQLFERAVSQFVKDNVGVMDLHSVLETLADEKVRDGVKNDFDNMASACGERFKPAPPLAPVAMSLKLAVAHFTNGADVAFVQGKYEATFLLVLGKAKKLSFTHMKWVTEEQWAAFCLEVLPQCASLEELNLGGNRNLKWTSWSSWRSCPRPSRGWTSMARGASGTPARRTGLGSRRSRGCG